MNGAVFFLTVNFIVAISFSAVFAVVSTRSRSRTAALWLAAAFAIASLSAVCELCVAYSGWPKIWALGAFATVMGGMLLLNIGIRQLYELRINWWMSAGFLVASLILSYTIYDLPRGTPLQAFSYQTPFALIVLASAFPALSSSRRLAGDRFLGILLLVTGVHFVAKAALAVIVGSGSTAKDYIHSNYALVSQSSTAVLMVAVGLTLLSVLALEIMAAERNESEMDLLSGLCNRRGFERGVKAAISRRPDGQHAVVLCDLDHFKNINDSYGHHAGDMVIRAFGALLSSSAPNEAIVGRMGGEEFAVFLPNTTMDVALLFAHALRSGTAAMDIAGIPSSVTVTASFGVANLVSADQLEEMLRRADVALYEAKRGGRNRVQQAANTKASRPAQSMTRP
ncbi:GGDEF domain-containing protein [Rhizobium deserti]|uniref:diguanylate cyclase n=1 Tax=Rhizobium deserti TaxID=2547961 RepID=A0A4R5UII5_9HYPH|nr:GGDEF domain-containing protein [Rhizobium deserti]TDK36631.1 GGDEF domain-containing protein [Rhizobium deserti]